MVYPVLTQQFKLSILIATIILIELKPKMRKCKPNLHGTYSDLSWIIKIISHPKLKPLFDDSIPFTALQSQHGSSIGLAITNHMSMTSRYSMQTVRVHCSGRDAPFSQPLVSVCWPPV